MDLSPLANALSPFRRTPECAGTTRHWGAGKGIFDFQLQLLVLFPFPSQRRHSAYPAICVEYNAVPALGPADVLSSPAMIVQHAFSIFGVFTTNMESEATRNDSRSRDPRIR